MKNILFILLINCACTGAFSQQKDFEGLVTYKVDVKPKEEGVTEKLMRTLLAMGDNMTVYIKQGNYRQSSGFCEVYYINKSQKVYYKFKNLDTLYYLDYASDTNKVINISRQQGQRDIAGVSCNSITLKTAICTRKFYFSPLFHLNPQYDKGNTLGNYDTYIRETESVWLGAEDDAATYTLAHTAIKIDQKPVADQVFDLPDLPVKKFTSETVTKEPEFARSMGWNKYLQLTINPEVGAKYIKIPKGETTATQTPIVSFMISETGQVLNAKVVNSKEVHPKVAEEALRVVMESRGWRPATVYGEKISFWLKQEIRFQVSK